MQTLQYCWRGAAFDGESGKQQSVRVSWLLSLVLAASWLLQALSPGGVQEGPPRVTFPSLRSMKSNSQSKHLEDDVGASLCETDNNVQYSRLRLIHTLCYLWIFAAIILKSESIRGQLAVLYFAMVSTLNGRVLFWRLIIKLNIINQNNLVTNFRLTFMSWISFVIWWFTEDCHTLRTNLDKFYVASLCWNVSKLQIHFCTTATHLLDEWVIDWLIYLC